MTLNPTFTHQKGMTTLFIAIVLLVATTTITLFQSRHTLMNMRMSTKEFNHQLAETIASSGVEQGIAYLGYNFTMIGESTDVAGWLTTPTKWVPCNDALVPCGDGTTQFYGNEMLVFRNVNNINTTFDSPGTTLAVHYLTPNEGGTGEPADLPRIKVVAEATVNGGRAYSVVRRSVQATGLYFNTPITPLTVSGASNFVGGNFNVWGNPVGNNGNPLSIWSADSTLPLSGSAETYDVTVGGGQYPNTSQTLSSSGNDGGDIIDNDPNFPNDIFYETFGIPKSDSDTLKSDATVLSSCTSLNSNSSGLIWVTGDCQLNGSNGPTVGTQAKPLTLIVEGELKMSSNLHYYGLIFVDENSPGTQITGTIDIHGALIVDTDFNKGAGTVNMHYDPTTLQNANLTGGKFNYILGSWGDTQ